MSKLVITIYVFDIMKPLTLSNLPKKMQRHYFFSLRDTNRAMHQKIIMTM